MALARLLSAASTHEIFTGTGTYYGVSYDPVAGGTIAVIDSSDVGHRPDINNPSTVDGTFLHIGPFDTSILPRTQTAPGVRVTNGLTVSYTSTKNTTVYYDN